jgi:hypothetical protein
VPWSLHSSFRKRPGSSIPGARSRPSGSRSP